MRSLPLLAALLLSIPRASAAPDHGFDGHAAGRSAPASLETPPAPKTPAIEKGGWGVLEAGDRKNRTTAARAGKAPGPASLCPIGKTIQGRDIWALRLCPDAQAASVSRKPGIAFMGMHHAREHLSNEVPLLLAKRLVENRK